MGKCIDSLACLHCPHPLRYHELEKEEEKWKCNYNSCTCDEFDFRMKGEVEGQLG